MKKLATSTLSLAVLLLISASPIRAIGTDVQAGQKAGSVLRVDLQKHFIPHQDIEELEENEEADTIYIEDTTYVQLRQAQNQKL